MQGPRELAVWASPPLAPCAVQPKAAECLGALPCVMHALRYVLIRPSPGSGVAGSISCQFTY